MNINDFIGVAVIDTSTQRRCEIKKITSPYIQVQTKAPNSSGYPSTYRFKTVNGDPFTNNLLKFEDASLLGPFMKAYREYCHTEDAYYEEIGYWMRKD